MRRPARLSVARPDSNRALTAAGAAAVTGRWGRLVAIMRDSTDFVAILQQFPGRRISYTASRLSSERCVTRFYIVHPFAEAIVRISDERDAKYPGFDLRSFPGLARNHLTQCLRGLLN